MLCATAPDTSVHQVCLDMLLAWGFHSCVACLTVELCMLRGTHVMGRAERRALA